MAKTPAAMETGSRFVKSWLDRLETTLKSEADLAGLLQHDTMVGSAREFFVSRILRSILPPIVHIGSGQVIGAESVSRQVDIILYDSRCPMMEVQPGMGMYFAEGVIGTIEVKSKLTPGKLKLALNNCASVMDVCACVPGPEAMEGYGRRLITEGVSPQQAQDAVHWRLTPRTYIFSLTTDMDRMAMTRAVSRWHTSQIRPRSPEFPYLPAVIATQGIVGLLADRWMLITPTETDAAGIRAQSGDDARIIMGVWSAQRQFGWMALRLMHDITQRFGLNHAESQITLALDSHFPVLEYHAESFAGADVGYIVWENPARKQNVTDQEPLDDEDQE
jgi:hypothetical protein